MDINQQLQPVVTALVESLKSELVDQVRLDLKENLLTAVVEKATTLELDDLINHTVTEQLNQRLTKYSFEATTKDRLTKLVDGLVENLHGDIVDAATTRINIEVGRLAAKIDIQPILDTLVEKKLGDFVKLGHFPLRSIPHSAVDFTDFKFTGSLVKGGIIENFGSTGIEDRASFVQMTLLDTAVVFENQLVVPSAQIKGNLTIDGNLSILGSIDQDCPGYQTLLTDASNQVRVNLNDELFEGFSGLISKKINESGLDLDRITQNGKVIVNDSQLGYHITDTNIQRLGIVKDLQTSGENLLSETLYVTNRRVGVNTMDPSAALSVWDEEIEIIAAKRRQDVGYIGTARRSSLVLGSNSQENIRLEPDGSVEIDQLSVGNVPMSSAAVIPNYAGRTGEIVWNEAPNAGGPVGWVCLGATRWAMFGRIE
jgi:hypothetical protein